MKVISLQSGSSGNCTYVEAGEFRLLFDAGISGRQAQARLTVHGRDITRVQALVISHDHIDHTRCLGILQRKFRIPVHITKGTLAAASKYLDLGKIADVCHFESGSILRFGNVSVETIPTPHDAADGVAFVIDDGTSRLGILTDLGHVFEGLVTLLQTLDAVVIESNYDPEMLANGPYPEMLKRRIRGPHGHLSNEESAELLRPACRTRLKWACLAHLSEVNNTPTLALETHQKVLGRQFPLVVAGRYAATDVLEV